MWKAVQTIKEGDEIDIQGECFEDGTNPITKKFKGADRTEKNWKASSTGKTLCRKVTKKR